VHALLDEALVDEPAPGAKCTRLPRHTTVEPADEEYLHPEPSPTRPEDFESRLEATRWHRCAAVGDGTLLKVLWFSGIWPLERVDVDERPDRVTITLWERLPPAFDGRGFLVADPLVLKRRCVEVPLRAPLGSRPVYDGATGKLPGDFDPGDEEEHDFRAEALAIELDALPCEPMPPGDPVPWDSLE
jgi:hypothetical protein